MGMVQDMARKIIIIVLIAVITTLFVPAVAQADDTGYFHDHTCYMYAGPWVWTMFDDGEGDIHYSWTGPEGTIGLLDLRSLPEQAQQGGTPGWGIFFCSAPINDHNYISLGTDFNLDLPPAVINQLDHKYGITLESYTVNGTIFSMFVDWGDPTGSDRWKPLVPESVGEYAGMLVIHINGFSPVVFGRDEPRGHQGFCPFPFNPPKPSPKPKYEPPKPKFVIPKFKKSVPLPRFTPFMPFSPRRR